MGSRLRGNDGDGMVDAGHGGGVRMGSRLRGNDGDGMVDAGHGGCVRMGSRLRGNDGDDMVAAGLWRWRKNWVPASAGTTGWSDRCRAWRWREDGFPPPRERRGGVVAAGRGGGVRMGSRLRGNDGMERE